MSETIPKSEWGPGPWQDEPDEHRWTDASTGYRCVAWRSPCSGTWCGYAGIGPLHPAYGLDDDGGTVMEGEQRMAAFKRAAKLHHKGIGIWRAMDIAYEDAPKHEPVPGIGERISEIRCHGGLTYAGELPNETAWFFGFDCAHAGDVMPGIDAITRRMYRETEWKERQRIFREDEYRTLSYVIEQITSVAAQLAEIEKTTVSIAMKGTVA